MEENQTNGQEENSDFGKLIPVSGMYQDWFLDYASYVILERAVPSLYDGLKPVQRRILHSMRELEDGRYNKVANVIGNTMKYHPHGDASIGDAMVQLGQKDYLIDTQGNWGNIYTGDSSAAPRYIEARLSKFALKVVFNPKTTKWLPSYDGRNKEPEFLPVKFPLLLSQGAEGIAVGMACKMLPHNFIELIDASIQILKGHKAKILPDFPTGGYMDASNYNDGLRGGKVKVRAKLTKRDTKTIVVEELPFGSTTSSLIDSVLKANDKGKIKIKKIEDNTAEHVEILIHLPSGVSPDKMIDALYAFTDCEVSISPNAAIILNDKPHFIGISEILKFSTENTKHLLKRELEIEKAELEERWHLSSLEKIFIENRIYRDIEECTTWESVLETINEGLKPFVKNLKRAVTEDDLVRLTEIKIKRISKFDSFKADELIKGLEEGIAEKQHHLDNLTEFAINYFKDLKKTFGAGRERKTEIRQFENIEATKVVVANRKLYVNKEEGFVGTGLKKEEFVCNCSDIDDVIVFRSDGIMMVSKVSDKAFFGKDIIHVGVWKKGDRRTIYNMTYQDGTTGPNYIKRFAVNSITRDKEYNLTAGTPKSKITYFSANPNGEAEIVQVSLRPRPHLRKLKFDQDFADIKIKGRASRGNILSKQLVSKVVFKEEGVSTLGARKLWYDPIVKRLNVDERGEYLGAFKGGDKILVVYEDGTLRLYPFDLTIHFDAEIKIIEKWKQDRALSVVYFDGEKSHYKVKRFLVEGGDKPTPFITEDPKSEMILVSSQEEPVVKVVYDQRSTTKMDEDIRLSDLIDVKGLKAKGNIFCTEKIKSLELISVEEEVQEEEIISDEEILEENGDDSTDQPTLFDE